ncbi:hypothetical protein ACFVGY_33140 [Streptomyces sp. NPDC127106]|uniref:hypothetical protein n=1 Tax=Streptomyces sp. NPDC127106 TaxID=3345360 RepID=UPI003635A64F
MPSGLAPQQSAASGLGADAKAGDDLLDGNVVLVEVAAARRAASGSVSVSSSSLASICFRSLVSAVGHSAGLGFDIGNVLLPVGLEAK